MAPTLMKLPQRLLMTADTVGGVWTFAVELVRALEPHGLEIALATMGPAPSREQRLELADCAHVRLFVGQYALEWMAQPWGEVDAAGQWLLELAGQFQPDVVHLNGYVHAALPWRRPVVVSAHSCVRSWWRAVRGGAVSPVFGEYRRRVKAGLDAANLVVAPTASMLDALEQEYGLDAPERVIANGRQDLNREPLGWEKKDRVIFSAGRVWDEAKNLALLDWIAPALPWPVRVAGDVASPDGQSCMPAHLQLLGRLPPSELAQELARAGIYAAPALYEPFGLAILEAGLAGCALVVSDLPSLREVWQEAALFVDPRDPEGWRSTLSALAFDAERRRVMGEKARAQALRFTPQRMAGSYLAAYGALMSALGVGEAVGDEEVLSR